MQIQFIGRMLASQAGEAGSIPVICLPKTGNVAGSTFSVFLILIWYYFLQTSPPALCRRPDHDPLPDSSSNPSQHFPFYFAHPCSLERSCADRTAQEEWHIGNIICLPRELLRCYPGRRTMERGSVLWLHTMT